MYNLKNIVMVVIIGVSVMVFSISLGYSKDKGEIIYLKFVNKCDAKLLITTSKSLGFDDVILRKGEPGKKKWEGIVWESIEVNYFIEEKEGWWNIGVIKNSELEKNGEIIWKGKGRMCKPIVVRK